VGLNIWRNTVRGSSLQPSHGFHGKGKITNHNNEQTFVRKESALSEVTLAFLSNSVQQSVHSRFGAAPSKDAENLFERRADSLEFYPFRRNF